MSFGCDFFVGDCVERELEGMYFPARILAVQPSNKYVAPALVDIGAKPKSQRKPVSE